VSLGFERETLVEARGPLRPGSLHEVIHLAAPAMAAAVSTFLMSLVDTIMVAGTGEGAVGAVTSSMMWLHVVTTALGGLVSAIATFASQLHPALLKPE